MACSTNIPNCDCKKTPCSCEKGISTAPFCGAVTCPNPEPCAEIFSDCCVVHNGDSFTYITSGSEPPYNNKFTVYEGERLCDILQRFIAYYECTPTSVPTPYGLKTTLITSSTFTLVWTPVTGAAQYKVFYAPVSTGIFVSSPNLNTTSYTATGLTANTAYYAYVIAIDSSSNLSCASVSLIINTYSS